MTTEPIALHGSRFDRSVSVAQPGVSDARPAPLPALYVSFAVFQALDAHSTRRALDAGAREANPLVGRLASSSAGLVAFKAATTAGMIYLVERVRKRNKAAAVVTMIGLNAAYAVIVSHNYAVASGQRR